MGNINNNTQDYISSFMPTCCGGTAPITDINTELMQRHSQQKSNINNTIRSRKKRKKTSIKISHPISHNKRKEIERLIVDTAKIYTSKPYTITTTTAITTKPSQSSRSRSSTDVSSASYYHGYITASTMASGSVSPTSPLQISNYHHYHNNNININNNNNIYSINERESEIFSIASQPPPLWKQSASIPDVYRDDAALILNHLKTERERESGGYWLDRYELDSLYVRNDFNDQWSICKIIQMNQDSICIYNNNKDEYQWIDKRSSKIRPRSSYIDAASKHCSIHQIKLQIPPLLRCHIDKLLYYHANDTNRDYVICCTEWNTFNSEYEAGVYLYDLNYNLIQYLSDYPVAPKNYFKATMDDRNEQLHIYCFPIWSILDIRSKRWNVTNINESVKYNVINMQPTASIIVDGILYIFGNGRFARFDKELMRFKEIGFDGIENKYIWEVNDVIYIKEQRRIYIFGVSDSDSSIYRMWYSDIWYIDIDDVILKWKRLRMRMPYYTNGIFADYSVVMGYKHILFLFYHKLKELWIFDLLYQKRFKSKKTIQIELGEYSKMIITNQNVIHSLCLDLNGPIHIKLSLNELLKNELKQFISKLEADLICGFIKRSFIKHIPLRCKTLIFTYYQTSIIV